MIMINKLFDWLNQSGRSLHLLAGFGILLISMIAFGLLSFNTYVNAAISSGIVFIAMIVKELYDKYIKKTFFDWSDVLAGMLFPVLLWFWLGICAILIFVGLGE